MKGTPVDEQQMEEIKKKIDDLKSRLPAHSVPPRMLEELDELEDELMRLQCVNQ